MERNQRSLLNSLAVATIAFTWIYQGAVPKLVFRQADEVALLVYLGIPTEAVPIALIAMGSAEVLFGLAVLGFSTHAWPFRLTITFAGVSLAAVAATAPHYLKAAFNPVTLNVLLAAMSVVALSTRPARGET